MSFGRGKIHTEIPFIDYLLKEYAE